MCLQQYLNATQDRTMSNDTNTNLPSQPSASRQIYLNTSDSDFDAEPGTLMDDDGNWFSIYGGL